MEGKEGRRADHYRWMWKGGDGKGKEGGKGKESTCSRKGREDLKKKEWNQE